MKSMASFEADTLLHILRCRKRAVQGLCALAESFEESLIACLEDYNLQPQSWKSWKDSKKLMEMSQPEFASGQKLKSRNAVSQSQKRTTRAGVRNFRTQDQGAAERLLDSTRSRLRLDEVGTIVQSKSKDRSSPRRELQPRGNIQNNVVSNSLIKSANDHNEGDLFRGPTSRREPSVDRSTTGNFFVDLSVNESDTADASEGAPSRMQSSRPEDNTGARTPLTAAQDGYSNKRPAARKSALPGTPNPLTFQRVTRSKAKLLGSGPAFFGDGIKMCDFKRSKKKKKAAVLDPDVAHKWTPNQEPHSAVNVDKVPSTSGTMSVGDTKQLAVDIDSLKSPLETLNKSCNIIVPKDTFINLRSDDLIEPSKPNRGADIGMGNPFMAGEGSVRTETSPAEDSKLLHLLGCVPVLPCHKVSSPETAENSLVQVPLEKGEFNEDKQVQISSSFMDEEACKPSETKSIMQTCDNNSPLDAVLGENLSRWASGRTSIEVFLEPLSPEVCLCPEVVCYDKKAKDTAQIRHTSASPKGNDHCGDVHIRDLDTGACLDDLNNSKWEESISKIVQASDSAEADNTRGILAFPNANEDLSDHNTQRPDRSLPPTSTQKGNIASIKNTAGYVECVGHGQDGCVDGHHTDLLLITPPTRLGGPHPLKNEVSQQGELDFLRMAQFTQSISQGRVNSIRRKRNRLSSLDLTLTKPEIRNSEQSLNQLKRKDTFGSPLPCQEIPESQADLSQWSNHVSSSACWMKVMNPLSVHKPWISLQKENGTRLYEEWYFGFNDDSSKDFSLRDLTNRIGERMGARKPLTTGNGEFCVEKRGYKRPSTPALNSQYEKVRAQNSFRDFNVDGICNEEEIHRVGDHDYFRDFMMNHSCIEENSEEKENTPSQCRNEPAPQSRMRCKRIGTNLLKESSRTSQVTPCIARTYDLATGDFSLSNCLQKTPFSVACSRGKRDDKVQALEADSIAQKQELKKTHEQKMWKLELEKDVVLHTESKEGLTTREWQNDSDWAFKLQDHRKQNYLLSKAKHTAEFKLKLYQQKAKEKELQKRKEEQWKQKAELATRKRKREEAERKQREQKRKRLEESQRLRKEQEEQLRLELEREQRRKALAKCQHPQKALSSSKRQRQTEREREPRLTRARQLEGKPAISATKEDNERQGKQIPRFTRVQSQITQMAAGFITTCKHTGSMSESGREKKIYPVRKLASTTTSSFPAQKTFTHEEKSNSADVQSYEISPYRSSSDGEEEEADRCKKPIPLWARTENLMPQLICQQHTDPAEIFMTGRACSLEEIFSTFKSKKRQTFSRRTGSGNWLQDQATWKEESDYKRTMGYVD